MRRAAEVRDGRRIQERVEVRLERMQLIWLTLGAVVALGVVFALGMMMGKRAARLEARLAPRDAVSEIDADGERHQELTFYNKLTAPAADAPKQRKAAALAPVTAPPSPLAASTPPPASPATAAVAPPAHREPPATAAVAATTPTPREPSSQPAAPAPTTSQPPANALATNAPLSPPSAQPPARSAPAAATVAPSETSASASGTDPEILAELKRGPAHHGEFTVQVSSFQTADEAKAYASSLERKGYHPFVVTSQVTGKGTWYRVRLGSFKDVERAKNAKALLARADIPAWILKTE